MIKLLEQAVAEIEKLPEDAQDAIAARLLADLADEKAWADRFSATAEAQWERMAALVRQEIRAEDTIPLDDIFPVGYSQPLTRASPKDSASRLMRSRLKFKSRRIARIPSGARIHTTRAFNSNK